MSITDELRDIFEDRISEEKLRVIFAKLLMKRIEERTNRKPVTEVPLDELFEHAIDQFDNEVGLGHDRAIKAEFSDWINDVLNDAKPLLTRRRARQLFDKYVPNKDALASLRRAWLDKEAEQLRCISSDELVQMIVNALNNAGSIKPLPRGREGLFRLVWDDYYYEWDVLDNEDTEEDFIEYLR